MKTYNFNLEVGHYGNGRLALSMVCLDGELYAHCTVNLVSVPLADDEVAIKDYSENEGMLDFLVQQNIVSPQIRSVSSDTGWVRFPICRFLGVPA